MTFGELIKQTRKSKKITQTELALSAKVSQGWICKIERSKGEPNITEALRIMVALGLPIKKLAYIERQNPIERKEV